MGGKDGSATKSTYCAGRWWRTPLVPALGKQRLVDLCEFEASVVYRVSSRTGSKATQRKKPFLKKNRKHLLFMQRT